MNFIENEYQDKLVKLNKQNVLSNEEIKNKYVTEINKVEHKLYDLEQECDTKETV